MSEKFYDEEIAPALLALCKKCQDAGIPFVARIEYEQGKAGRTQFLPESAGIAQRIATWAAACDGNVDSLMIAIARYAKDHGHSSLVLSILERKP